MLVATDVAARGIHVDEVGLVLQVDPPAGPKEYLHRAGRTARAGGRGRGRTLALPQQRREVERLTSQAGVHTEPMTAEPGDATLAAVTGARAPNGLAISQHEYDKVIAPPAGPPAPPRTGNRSRGNLRGGSAGLVRATDGAAPPEHPLTPRSPVDPTARAVTRTRGSAVLASRTVPRVRRTEQRLSLVTFGATDLERATRFYEAQGWQRLPASTVSASTYRRPGVASRGPRERTAWSPWRPPEAGGTIGRRGSGPRPRARDLRRSRRSGPRTTYHRGLPFAPRLERSPRSRADADAVSATTTIAAGERLGS